MHRWVIQRFLKSFLFFESDPVYLDGEITPFVSLRDIIDFSHIAVSLDKSMLKYYLQARREFERAICMRTNARNGHVFTFAQDDVLDTGHMQLMYGDHLLVACSRIHGLRRRPWLSNTFNKQTRNLLPQSKVVAHGS